MDPAIALCTGVAAIALTAAALGALPDAGRRLATMPVPLPRRHLSVLLVVASLTAVIVRTPSAGATVAPPIVRLADGPQSAVDAPALPDPTVARSAGMPGPAGDPHSDFGGEMVVERGDSLWRIASRVLLARSGSRPTSADVARFWPAIYEANRTVIGDDPNLIFPGQRLLIPEG